MYKHRECVPPKDCRLPRHRLTVEPLEARLLLDGATAAIQDMVDSVTEQSYTDYLAEVTSFPDRNSYTENIGDAADYIVAELEGMGLEVELQSFDLPSLGDGGTGSIGDSVTVSNIIATIPGQVTPEQEYIFTAHYDSVAVHPDDYSDPMNMVIDLLSPSSPAPGADDNGSGTAALLQTAEVLSSYPFESTVKFVFFTAEEQGLVGSDTYTKYAYYEDPTVEDPVADPDNILGVINYDMIAYWDGTPDGGEDIDVIGYNGATYGIDEYPNIEDILTTMNPDLTPEQVEYVISSLTAMVPPPPADTLDTSLLGQTFQEAADTYGTGLDINYMEGSTSEDWWLTGASSDHFNFWWYGWPALMCIEDIVHGVDPVTGYPYSTVTNPYYHSTDDTLENINAEDFAASVTQTGMATIAELAGVRVDVAGGDFQDGDLSLYEVEGDVALVETEPGDYSAELRESSPAAISQKLVVPSDEGTLQFDARFVDPGDGDFLTVEFNGNEVARLTGGQLSSGWDTFSADMAAYVGQPGTLTFRLNSTGDPNATYQVDNVLFSSSPPVVGSLTDTPDPVIQSENLTLEAGGVSDPDGTVSLVEFYRDDGDGAFESGQDTLLGTDSDGTDGWSWTGSTAGWTAGTYTYFARAQDDSSEWSNAASATGTVQGSGLIASNSYAEGPTVSLYDTDPSNGVMGLDVAWSRSDLTRSTQVYVNPGRNDGDVSSILLLGEIPDGDELGIVVEDAGNLGVLKDARRTAGPLGFLASEGAVGVVNLRGGIAGANLAGFTAEAGWTPGDDVDGDGDDTDPTALYSTGGFNTIVARGSVGGDVVSGGPMGVMLVVGGDVTGDIRSDGDVRLIKVIGGDVNGAVDVDGGLKSLMAIRGSLNGPVNVMGDAGVIKTVFGDVGDDVNVGGGLRVLQAIQGGIAGDVEVGANANVIMAIGGDISGDVHVVGDLNVIKAVRGDITGSVDVDGDLGVAAAVQGGMLGPIDVAGNARAIQAIGGDCAGPIYVGGDAGRILATRRGGGGAVNGDIDVGGGLGVLFAGHDLSGNVDAGGALGRVLVGRNLGPRGGGSNLDISAASLLALQVRGDMQRARVETDDQLSSVSVLGDFTNSTLEADRLSRVMVIGNISEDGSDGDTDHIHADQGMFFVRHRGGRGWMDRGPRFGDRFFGGVRAFVGGP